MKALGLILLAVLVCGCTPQPKAIKTGDAQSLIDAMVFVRHPGGLCFGLINSERVTLRGDLSQSIAVTQVDCAAVAK